MAEDFDFASWEKRMGGSNLDPTDPTATVPTKACGLGLVFPEGIVPIDNETLVKANALLQGLVRQAMDENVGNPLLAAGILARQEASSQQLAALLMATNLDAISFPTPDVYNLALDIMTAYCHGHLLPQLFSNAADIHLPALTAYGQILMAGFKLGQFLNHHPLVG